MNNTDRVKLQVEEILRKKKELKKKKVRNYQHEYYLAHREEILAERKRKYLDYQHSYYFKNRERILEYKKKKYKERKLKDGSKNISSQVQTTDI